MRFLIAFDLPSHSNPEREYDRPTLATGRLQAKRMHTELKDHLQSPTAIPFFLYVQDGGEWVPHYKIKNLPS